MTKRDKYDRDERRSSSKRDTHGLKNKAQTGHRSSSPPRVSYQQAMEPGPYQPPYQQPLQPSMYMAGRGESSAYGVAQTAGYQLQTNIQPAEPDQRGWDSWPSEPGSFGLSNDNPRLATEATEREIRRQYAINHPGAPKPSTQRLSHAGQISGIDDLGLGYQGYPAPPTHPAYDRSLDIELDDSDEQISRRKDKSSRHKSSDGHRRKRH